MYTRVESRFWTDERIREVSQEARYLMLYLLTNPHRNILGLYYLPPAYACHDLGWPEKRFQERLGELLRKGVIWYDQSSCLLWIVNYLKHNPLENPNQVKAAMEVLGELPKSPVYGRFYERMKQFNKPFYEPLLERLRNGMPNQEQDQDQDQDQDKTHTSSPAPPVVSVNNVDKPKKRRNDTAGPDYNAEFLQFWMTYPRKVGKGAAWRAWQNAKGRPPVEELIAAVERAKKTEQWQKENGRFIPHPATWLNQRRWEDEPEAGSAPPRREVKLPPCGCRAGLTAVRDAQGRIEVMVCKQCGAPQVRYE